MQVHFLIHAPFERSGVIEDWAFEIGNFCSMFVIEVFTGAI